VHNADISKAGSTRTLLSCAYGCVLLKIERVYRTLVCILEPSVQNYVVNQNLMLSLSGRLTQFTFIIVIKGMKLAFLCANPNYPLSTGAVCVSAAFYLQLCCLCEFPLQGLKNIPVRQ
jgi:hypothetical protein